LKQYTSAEEELIENQTLHSVRPDQIIEHDPKLARKFSSWWILFSRGFFCSSRKYNRHYNIV